MTRQLSLNRRDFLKLVGAAALFPAGCAPREESGVWVNDVHAKLNRTRVLDRLRPTSVDGIRRALARCRRDGHAVSVAGGRHAMGGQQFAEATVHLDMTHMNKVLNFDAGSGLVDVEAGIQWPRLLRDLNERQSGQGARWAIAQKQSGTDRLTIGGTLAANAHGRGLAMKPIIADVDSFNLMDADGEIRRCSRTENEELFRLAIGGYGLFGIITSVRLQLVPRRKLERVVEVIDTAQLMDRFNERIADGYLYGDCQFAIDESSSDYIKRGVFSCYRPVPADTPLRARQKRLSEINWRELILLAHRDKGRAFERYSSYYLTTSGQIYYSDLHQLSTYMDDYHTALDVKLDSPAPATEIISELYVPRPDLEDFLAEVRADFRTKGINLIYGTIRLIERDDESFLPWAQQGYVCVIFNIHTPHTTEGIERSAGAFRRLIDMAAQRGGSYFLTYHRFARRDQVEACYPGFVGFLRAKRRYDPSDRWQSDWYRHYVDMFADALG